MYLIAIIITLLSSLLVRNDSMYTPKSKRSKTYHKMKKYGNIIIASLKKQMVVIENYLVQNVFIVQKRAKKRKKRPRMNSRWYRLAFSATAMRAEAGIRSNVTTFDTDSAAIGIDNRCSACISHIPEDFIGGLIDSKRTIKGFAGSKTTGIKTGTIKWSWLDDNGVEHTFNIPNSYYVPQGKVRLLSPQHWAKHNETKCKKTQYKGTLSQTTSEEVTLLWNNRKSRLTVPLAKENNVATFYLAPGFSKYFTFCAETELDTETDRQDPLVCQDAQQNNLELEDTENEGKWTHEPRLTIFHDTDIPKRSMQDPEGVKDDSIDVQKSTMAEFLLLHQRMGHIPFQKMKIMARQQIIPKKFAKCPIPVCAACTYAKLTKKAWRNKPEKAYKSQSHAKGPGDVVSVDQLVSPTPGLIAQMTGRLTTKRYKYATVFVDQFSKYGYVHIQKTATAEETIEAKNSFESHLQSMGVRVKSYQADNGIFRAHKWVDACKEKHQSLSFVGVNAHHQNGHAERRIRELQGAARANILHAVKRWVNGPTANLWPYALRMASNTYNNSPSLQLPSSKTPLQVLSGSDVNTNPKHHHSFGCPAYVLTSDLQQGKPFGKWKRRAEVGIYLGPSPHHNRNVGLILNRKTGLVSPQFHIKYDNSFDTTNDIEAQEEWKIRAGFVRNVIQNNQMTDKLVERIPDISNDLVRKSDGDNTSEQPLKKLKTQGTSDTKKSVMESGPENTNRSQSNRKEDNKVTEKILRRSPRLNPEISTGNKLIALQTMISNKSKDSMEVTGEILAMPVEVQSECKHPMAFKASSDPDIMYMHEAMKRPDKKEFITAMQKEVEDQMMNGNFSIVHKSSVPKDKVILPAVWQMRRKRDIKTRQVKKYKARLNIDGSRMKHGIHYDQTYAPVASWNSIRLLLILVATMGWHTQQIDYVLAFPQAPVEKEIYMKIPKGFRVTGNNHDDYVLKLNKNVYGQKQAGRVWNKFLEKKLINEVGFTKSKYDECVFYKNKTIYILYTDDSILAGPDKDEINQIIRDIQEAGLDITKEGDIKDFLGVNINKKNDGSVELTQPHLIDQILEDLKMKEDVLKEKETPAKTSQILHRGEGTKPFDNSFHYRSVIGKLNYLEKGTRSDISYITHQCARFTESPKEIHAKAIRWVARYLKGTRNKGLILKPDRQKGLELFVDADFAGNWDKNDTHNPDTARSRHGYIIKFMGCPVVWKSQLQHEIALSSTESEYTGLSYALREAIPIMGLVQEMNEKGYIPQYDQPKVYCQVYEDNSGALEMASVHKYRPRTKHLNVKLHHFRDYVDRGEIKIAPINSSDQEADYLTKPVTVDILRKLRARVMGW